MDRRAGEVVGGRGIERVDGGDGGERGGMEGRAERGED